MEEKTILSELQAEKLSLDSSYVHAAKLLDDEINKVQSGGAHGEGNKKSVVDVTSGKPVKISEKVRIPASDHPQFNFVGKLLGPKGNSLKRLQEETGTKMSILGRGSMRDKNKEEELRKEGGKYQHLNDDLHVFVEIFAPPPEAYNRLSVALNELKKYLIPISDFNDDIRQKQLEELMYINGEDPSARGGRGGRGRGGPPSRGRGAPVGGLLSTPGRGRGAPRGAPPLRGGAPRGNGLSRGMSSRGAPAGLGYGRGALSRPPPPPEPLVDTYQDAGYGPGAGGYEEQGYGDQAPYRETYEHETYDAAPSDTQYFDYGHGSGGSARNSYEEGYGEASWRPTPSYGKVAPSPRGKTDYRAHPYGIGRGSAPPRY